MADSKTEICNMALAHLGVGKPIADLDTDRDKTAQACRTFYETALRATLRDFAWPFATAFVDLSLISEDPTDEWNYSYGYPANCLKLRRILSGLRNDNRQSRIPYKFVETTGAKVIYTDMQDAAVEYTLLREDVEAYPDDFVLALSRRIASYIAPLVTGGDPFKLQEKNMQLYMYEITLATANSLNEEQMEEQPDGEQIRFRNS